MPKRLGAAVAVVAVALVACGTSRTPREAGARIQVVAAENFWGSIAAQLAGDRADVSSIITNPATDPHDYEATPQDARDLAMSDYVVVNGIGYDGWAQKLLDANPSSGRSVLDIGKLVGAEAGGNPHQWYSPSTVKAVVARIAADLARLDPDNAGFYARRRATYERSGLAEYNALIAEIKADYAGTPIGGSESIVVPLVSALGLSLRTPASYLDATAEGIEPTARDTAIVNQQIAQKRIDVFVYNRQNATPDVQRLVESARDHGIEVSTVTETMPTGVRFQDWQVRVLRSLRDALERATVARSS